MLLHGYLSGVRMCFALYVVDFGRGGFPSSHSNRFVRPRKNCTSGTECCKRDWREGERGGERLKKGLTIVGFVRIYTVSKYQK